MLHCLWNTVESIGLVDSVVYGNQIGIINLSVQFGKKKLQRSSAELKTLVYNDMHWAIIKLL